MSSFLPNLVVADTLKKLNLSGLVSPADLQAKINAGLDRLNDLKHDDGGWGWWKEDDSRVFMTAYVVSGLAEAKSRGICQGRCQPRRGSGLSAEAAGAASAHDSRTAGLRDLCPQPGRHEDLGSSRRNPVVAAQRPFRRKGWRLPAW